VATADIKRQADIVAGLEPLDRLSNLQDHAKVFVPEDAALLEIGPALVHVQVGTANVGRGNFDDGVSRTFDFRIRDVFDCYLTGTPIDDSFHGLLL
jgi:hypothetical protein